MLYVSKPVVFFEEIFTGLELASGADMVLQSVDLAEFDGEPR